MAVIGSNFPIFRRYIGFKDFSWLYLWALLKLCQCECDEGRQREVYTSDFERANVSNQKRIQRGPEY